jgi:hypothetical protein
VIVVFDKKSCERCGIEYRASASGTRGKQVCPDCCKHCSKCGANLPLQRWFGQTSSVETALFGPMVYAQREYKDKPWIGSGLCTDCYNRKISQEEEEERILRKAKLVEAKEILKTPTVWECNYCKAINRGNLCDNCGSPRKKTAANVFNPSKNEVASRTQESRTENQKQFVTKQEINQQKEEYPHENKSNLSHSEPIFKKKNVLIGLSLLILLLSVGASSIYLANTFASKNTIPSTFDDVRSFPTLTPIPTPHSIVELLPTPTSIFTPLSSPTPNPSPTPNITPATTPAPSTNPTSTPTLIPTATPIPTPTPIPQLYPLTTQIILSTSGDSDIITINNTTQTFKYWELMYNITYRYSPYSNATHNQIRYFESSMGLLYPNGTRATNTHGTWTSEGVFVTSSNIQAYEIIAYGYNEDWRSANGRVW